MPKITNSQLAEIVEELEEHMEVEDLGEDETGGIVQSAFLTQRGHDRLREMIEALEGKE